MRQEREAVGPAKAETEAAVGMSILEEKAETGPRAETASLRIQPKASVLSADPEEAAAPQLPEQREAPEDDPSWAWPAEFLDLLQHTIAAAEVAEQARSVTEVTVGTMGETEKLAKEPELEEAVELERISELPETAETGMME